MRQDRDRWDVFCRVVDNYGDAGVAWRLARCLAREHAKQVRLVLDDVSVLARLRNDVDAARSTQHLEGAEIVRWADSRAGDEAVTPGEVADVVVETFGCDTPEPYVRAMAARSPHPCWINLEYLSAEDWVEGSHGLPSPHPKFAPLTRHFFFPGFTSRTGGLLRERDLLRRRDVFQSDRAVQEGFWQSITGRTPSAGTLKMSLFAYAGAPVASLLDALARHPGPVWAVVPEGPAAAAAKQWLGERSSASRGGVETLPIAFLDQDRYDQLLWSCDLNFVRGEDSFVRAQWAARPFVWQVYPTADGAHWVKLAAFLARYAGSMHRDQASRVTALWEAWNRGAGVASAWPSFGAALAEAAPHAEDWAQRLARQPDLVTQLADFADNVLKFKAF